MTSFTSTALRMNCPGTDYVAAVQRAKTAEAAAASAVLVRHENSPALQHTVDDAVQ